MPLASRSFLRPGAWAGSAAAAGAFVGHETAASVAWATLSALLAGVLAVLAPRLRLPALLVRPLLLLLVFAAGLAAGALAPKARQDAALDAAIEAASRADAPVRFAGRLAEPVQRRLAPPRWRSDDPQPRLTLVVDVDAVHAGGDWVPVAARALVGGDDVPIEAKVGDEVEGLARLWKPEAPQNPGEPDARPRLRRAGIAYVGSLQRGALASTRVQPSLARRAEDFRGRFSAFVHARVGERDRAALVAALAVGERGGVSMELEEAFNASGLAHVLSISGLHLAVAVLVLYRVLRRLFGLSEAVSARVAPKRLAAAVALPVSIAYVVLIGAPPPAVRAGIGTGLALVAVLAGRRPDAANTLGWCLAAVAMLDPAALALPATQLSFLGVAGLVYLTPRLRELVPVAPPATGLEGLARSTARAREAVLQLALGSIAATLATAPITAAYFERASLVAALANVVAWPASTLIVPAGALAAAVFPISPAIAGPLVDLAAICAWLLEWAARAFASWPLAAVQVSPPSPPAIAAYAALVACVVNVKRWRRAPAIGGAAIATAVLAFLAWPSRAPADGRLEVTFLSVGQGDSTFVRFPQGRTMLVDAGGEVSGRFDPGERIVTPFLRARDTRRIDYLVASHPHPDHIGGMPALLARFDVGELWHDGDGTEEGPLAELIATARAAGAEVVDFRQGLPPACAGLPPLGQAIPAVAALAVGDPRCAAPKAAREIDGVKVELLHPLNGPDRAAFPELGENDNSLVVRLVFGEVKVLLPGDVEHEGESLLLARPAELEADILKAPHHGSRTSSTDAFVRRVKPKHVVFCVGRDNQFGFPARDVDERYARAGCARYRTDEGAISFVTDGRAIEVRRW